jgi:hypothetical protein
MNIKDTLEEATASIFDRARDTTDSLVDRIGSESRHLGEQALGRVTTSLENLSEAALAKMSLVTQRTARRRTFYGVLIGIFAGFILGRIFMRARNARAISFESSAYRPDRESESTNGASADVAKSVPE